MLIVKEPTEKFNTEEIRRGTLVYAKHKTWENGEKGFVTTASEDEVIVQYPPKIGNVTNHFFLRAEEVAKGDWEVRYTNDMETIVTYPAGGTNEPETADL